MASGAEVRVVAAIRVPLLRRSPPHLEQIPLSLFDVWFLPQPPIQRLFLYDDDGGGGGADDYFPSLVESLRSSLADAVAVFFPLAGKLTPLHRRRRRRLLAVRRRGRGRAESDGDARALSAAKRHDVPAFLRLVPSLEAPELPAPVLAVQVTRFVGGGGRGGVAVGVAVHHAVADGLSFWRFMDVWSAAARGRPSPPAPAFDRSAIVHPMAADVARRILRKVTPELPLANVATPRHDHAPSAVADGVAFLEVEVDGGTPARTPTERLDVPAFLRLVPSLEVPELPAPVLAVQATRFVGGGGGGGVAVGVAVHHAVADGQSFWRFMDVWSAAARGRPSPPAPVFDRSAIVHPMAADVARRILRKVTPELPLANVATPRHDHAPSAVADGVAFLEVEVDGGTPARTPTERLDVPAFLRLVPSLEVPELPAPVLAVQATRFVGGGGGGGVAVGVAVHHAVADGQSFWRFMDAWSAAARGRPSPPAPAFDRSAIVHPMAADMARRILRKKAPELPLIPTANLLRRTWERHVVTTLELDSHRIGHIKNRIAELDEATTASPGTERRPRRLPSTFVAVAALVWSSVVRARASRQPDDGARAHLVFPADCRWRLDPPVDAAYFGNCVRCCVAGAAAGDLADAHRGVLHAREAIREAIDGFLEHPMVEAFDAWIDAVAALVRQPGFVAVTASPRFQVYEVDLGWGAPSRVEFASESLPNGMVAMTAGRKEASVQVMATLRPEHMEAFRSQLLYW
uniref:Uncharacterized protein n=1 Tax=Oryza rufipogon TaxID=4529 RepID=A0A0E0MUX5_ORYRU